ncbi:hypothetical protein CK203_013582 [Vitis vinifera]|uniref:Uncharacterized protein n=1 Tax=Vitis vinifera TaxID=29760 RepID=A0A438J8U4_VITVI|nr:hypothetical protein CK203_013582 [Vitis vinifera]
MAKDPLTLARAVVTCFNETPTPRGGFARGSPLHLASANGYVEMVNILLSADTNACLIHDEDGRTPLHLAVMKGQLRSQGSWSGARPQATRYKLDQGETILHSVLKQNCHDPNSR